MKQPATKEVEIRYIKYLAKTLKRSANTVRAYEHDISGLGRYLVNNKVLYPSEITLHHLRDYIGGINGETATKARQQTSIKSFFKFMYQEGVILKNPAEMLDSLKVEQKAPAYLTQGQFISLIKVVELATPYYKERDLALINIMAKSGLRRAEIISLNVGDIDLEKNRIRVKRKGGNTVYVFIHNELKEDIERYLKTIDRNNDEPLFTSRLNRRIDASTIWRTIKRYAHRAGLEDSITVHSLRHTFATTLLRQGLGLHSIQKLMNHKSLETTSRYLHIEDGELEDDFNKISFKQQEQLV